MRPGNEVMAEVEAHYHRAWEQGYGRGRGPLS